MTLLELINEFRFKLNDTVTPYLWSDAEVKSYINEAQIEACERSKLLYCKDLDIGKITISNNINNYIYSNKFIKIERVLLNNIVLKETSKSELDSKYTIRNFEDMQGTPYCYYIESNKIILFPKPDTNNNGHIIQLEGFIRPVNELVNNTDEPEIPKELHRKMLSFAYKLAYEKQDTETFDPNRASYHEDQFTRYFGYGIDANVLRKQGESRARFVKCKW